MLYDGSPFHPTKHVLLDYAEQEHITLFGTSAKYIDGLRQAELRPIETHGLDGATDALLDRLARWPPVNYR